MLSGSKNIYAGFYKECTRCGQIKRKVEFARDNRNTKSGIKSYCKECDNKRPDKDTRKLRNKNFVYEYLHKNPCVNCGITDIRVLEFNHIKPGKVADVTDLMHRGVSIRRITEEIDKCEVRCRNCHKERTWEQNNYWKEFEEITKNNE